MPNKTSVRNLLTRRLTELNETTHDIDDALRTPQSQDWDDKATENEEEEVLEDRGNLALTEIAEINAALQRLELGTYGTCTHCGDPIDEKRLTAVPAAAHCVSCAESLDG